MDVIVSFIPANVTVHYSDEFWPSFLFPITVSTAIHAGIRGWSTVVALRFLQNKNKYLSILYVLQSHETC